LSPKEFQMWREVGISRIYANSSVPRNVQYAITGLFYVKYIVRLR
jgi:hypothetical protein